jgi:hypothetical protein
MLRRLRYLYRHLSLSIESFKFGKIWQRNDWQRNGKKTFQDYSPGEYSSAKHCFDFPSVLSKLVLVSAWLRYDIVYV